MTLLHNPLTAKAADDYIKAIQVILAGEPATGSDLLNALQAHDVDPEQQKARLRQALELYPQARFTGSDELTLIQNALGNL
jgi:hypothetical protein